MAELLLCSIIWGFVAFKFRIVDKMLANVHRIDVVIAIILSITFIPTQYHSLSLLISIFENKGEMQMDTIAVLPSFAPYISFFLSHKLLILIPVIAFAAISLCFIFIYLLGCTKHIVIDFFRGLEKFEKNFLIIGCTLCSMMLILLFNLTNVFYQPSLNGEIIPYDVIYTTDTGALLNSYVYPVDLENDMRQPLFGIFALPFGLFAKFISYIIPTSITYPISMNIIQIILLLVTIILLSRMLEVSKTTRLFFLLFAVSSFPVMLFALNMEQYIFAVFWTILLIYNSYSTRKTNNIMAVAATGSILTSAILVPLLMVLNKEFALIIKKGFKMVMLFFSVFICGGMIDVIYRAGSMFTKYEKFVSNNGFIDKFQQFTHFIASCFIAPCSRIVSDEYFVAYRLCENYSLNMFGILLLGLSLLAAWLFREKIIAKISLFWICFAFVLISLFGWGIAENGTILYAYYIFWSFATLLVLLIDKVISKTRNITKYLVYGILVLALMVYNIIHLMDIINFGIKYYAV